MYFLSMNLPCKLGVFPYNKIGQSTTIVVRLPIAYSLSGISPTSQTVFITHLACKASRKNDLSIAPI